MSLPRRKSDSALIRKDGYKKEKKVRLSVQLSEQLDETREGPEHTESRNVKTAPSTPEEETRGIRRNKSATSVGSHLDMANSVHKKATKLPSESSVSDRKTPPRDESPKPRKKSKNEKFHKLFKSIPQDETVLNSFSCAYIGDILLQGILYISPNYFCFHSRILVHQKQIVIHVSEVLNLTREKTAFIIPNAIGILTCQDKYVFGSLMQRDTTFKLLSSVWKNHKNGEGFELPINRTPSPGSEDLPQIELNSGSEEDDLSEGESSISHCSGGHDSLHSPLPADPTYTKQSRLPAVKATSSNGSVLSSSPDSPPTSQCIDNRPSSARSRPPSSQAAKGCTEVKKALGHIIVKVTSMPKERQLSLLSIVMLMNLLLTMTAYSYCVVSLQTQVDTLSTHMGHGAPGLFTGLNTVDRNSRLDMLYDLLRDYNLASLLELQGDLKANLQVLQDMENSCKADTHKKTPSPGQ